MHLRMWKLTSSCLLRSSHRTELTLHQGTSYRKKFELKTAFRALFFFSFIFFSHRQMMSRSFFKKTNRTDLLFFKSLFLVLTFSQCQVLYPSPPKPHPLCIHRNSPASSPFHQPSIQKLMLPHSNHWQELHLKPLSLSLQPSYYQSWAPSLI